MIRTAHDQLVDEIEVVAVRVGAVLGVDLFDLLVQRAHDRAPALLAAVLDETDDRVAAGTAVDVMALLWGQGDPDPDWWHTLLGRLLARPLAREDTESVTHSVAAAMLGVTRGTVRTDGVSGHLGSSS